MSDQNIATLPKPIPLDWRPQDAVFELLQQRGIDKSWAEKQIAEFVLYWNERGEVQRTWGNKFFKHCLYEWSRQPAVRENALLRASKTVAMVEHWRPGQRAAQALQQAGVPVEFIEQCISEFIIYWMERGDISSTWNSKFVQNTKRYWAKQQAQNTGVRQTRNISLTENLTDRTWAD